MKLRRLTVMLLSSVGVCATAGSAQAFDLFSTMPMANQSGLPAVSAVNGKFELDAGMVSGSPAAQAAGSLTFPVSQMFGVQGDFTALMSGGGMSLSGVGHMFTRDPSLYLAGFAGGVVVTPDAHLVAGGFEGQLYLDRFTLDMWAGLASIDYTDPSTPDGTGPFAMADLLFYPTSDLRLAAGGAVVLGDASLHLGMEYLLHNFTVPVSFVSDARIHADGNYKITFGLKGYFGGNDPSKSLLGRDREDTVPNRSIDLFGASMGVLSESGGSPPPPDDPEYAACVADEGESPYYYFPSDEVGPWNPEGEPGYWIWNDETEDCDFSFGSLG